jgi:GDP-L-fucose synthase
LSDFYCDKKVVVTGATGLNGSYLVRALADRGARVRAIAHKRQPNNYTKLANEIVHGSLLETDFALKALEGAEIVMHAAGIQGGAPLAVSDPGAMVGPNAVINSQVIHACAKLKVQRLGFISSIVVYPPSENPMKEDDAWSGEPYPLYAGLAWVKRFSEKMCEFYSKNTGLKIAIVRPSGSYGRFDNFDETTSHVVPAILKRAASGEDPLKVWGDGNDTRDFIHASDIAEGLLAAVEKHCVCDPINIATGKDITTRELAETALRVAGSKAKIEFDPSKPTALKVRRVDITKARTVLDFEPMVSLEDGLSDTLKWYLGGEGKDA